MELLFAIIYFLKIIAAEEILLNVGKWNRFRVERRMKNLVRGKM